MLTDWASRSEMKRTELEHAVANLQGASGVLAHWHAAGPLPADAAARLALGLAQRPGEPKAPQPRWQSLFGAGTESSLRLEPAKAARRGRQEEDWELGL